MINLLKILIILTVIFTSVAWATMVNSNKKKVKNIFFCPDAHLLKKDPKALTWSAPGGWKSYEISFASNIKKFIGAQWNGARVGQITCVYQGLEASSFPVLLVFHTLTLEPNNGKWSKNLGGYRNCISTQQKDCPFQMQLKPKSGNIYQEAEELKSTPDNSQPPAF